MNSGQHLRLKETREQAMSDTNVDATVGKSQQNKMGRPPRAKLHPWMYVTGQILFQANFDLTWVDSQFPLSPSPNLLIMRARRQRKLKINLV